MKIKTHSYIISDHTLRSIIRNAYNHGYRNGGVDELCGGRSKNIGLKGAITNGVRTAHKEERKYFE